MKSKLEILREERTAIEHQLDSTRNDDMRYWLQSRLNFISREISLQEAKISKQRNQISGVER
jgi:hypothetical protein